MNTSLIVPCPPCAKGQVCPLEICYAAAPVTVPVGGEIFLVLIGLALILVAREFLRGKR